MRAKVRWLKPLSTGNQIEILRPQAGPLSVNIQILDKDITEIDQPSSQDHMGAVRLFLAEV